MIDASTGNVVPEAFDGSNDAAFHNRSNASTSGRYAGDLAGLWSDGTPEATTKLGNACAKPVYSASHPVMHRYLWRISTYSPKTTSSATVIDYLRPLGGLHHARDGQLAFNLGAPTVTT